MVIVLSKPEPNNEQISDGVNLLVSILLRYPEIGTVSFDPEEHCLKFKIMLSALPTDDEFLTIKNLIIDSITAYNMLEGFPSKMRIYELELSPHGQVGIINISRDIYTISKDEITLLTTLLRDHLTNYLIIEMNDTLSENDFQLQEDVIEDMLEKIKYYPKLSQLIGIREESRILVFNK